MFSKKPLSLDKQIQTHLMKLQQSIKSQSRHSQFTISENYEVKLKPDAHFVLHKDALLYDEAKMKSDKIRFLQKVSDLLAEGELTPKKLSHLLHTYPRSDEGIFSKTSAIIKLIQEKLNKEILLDNSLFPSLS